MILWLDDIRDPAMHGYIGAHWVRTAEEAIEALKTGQYRFASLDHDLKPEHYPWNCISIRATIGTGTGYDVCVWLRDHPQYWPLHGCEVHSQNEEGSAMMQTIIDAHYTRNNT